MRCPSSRPRTARSPARSSTSNSTPSAPVIYGDYLHVKEGDLVKAPGVCSLKSPSARRCSGALSTRCGPPDRQRPSDPGGGVPQGRHHRAPGIAERPAGARAAADGHQGRRLDDPRSAGPARTDHRRPQDGQDGRRHRHDHQSEAVLGARPTRWCASTSPSARRSRRSRASSTLSKGAMDYTIVVNAGASDPPDAIHRTLRRVHDGRVLHVAGQGRQDAQARPVHLRRLVEAGRRVPPVVAAAAASARDARRTRRRVLSPLAPLGARDEALRTRTARAR